ncbi:hypothetical protein, partial [Staphylococcus aureus]|uniref:hypothetical protein n=1 Tax=Staphylococcus aureus TaxID=1280 RepID=UPI001C409D3A
LREAASREIFRKWAKKPDGSETPREVMKRSSDPDSYGRQQVGKSSANGRKSLTEAKRRVK